MGAAVAVASDRIACYPVPGSGNSVVRAFPLNSYDPRITTDGRASVFEHSSEGIVITDQDNRIVMVNSAFFRLSGYSAEDVLGRDSGLLFAEKTPPEVYREMWRAWLETNSSS
jgi:PAS domain-containing protein